MSNAPKKNVEETTFVTLNAEEFSRVCKRVNGMLTARVQRAWEKKRKQHSDKAASNHIEASKDAFAFIHLMDLVEHMSEEIHDLRMELAASDCNCDDDDRMAIVGDAKKRSYLN